MKTMNKVFLIGNLGADPELRQSENGVPFTRLNVATHRSKGKDADEDVTEWHSVYVWGIQAQNCAKWLSKGALVFIEGEMRQIITKTMGPASEDQEARESRLSLVHAHEVKFLNSRVRPLDNLAGPRNHDAVAQR